MPWSPAGPRSAVEVRPMANGPTELHGIDQRVAVVAANGIPYQDGITVAGCGGWFMRTRRAW